MPRVVVAGSVNMDIVTRVDRFPHPGETLLGGGVRFTPGGKGSNQAIAADPFGEQLRAFLDAEGVDTAGVVVSATAPTGTAVITVDAAGENTIVVASGANSEVSPADVEAVPLDEGDIVVSQYEVGTDTIAALFTRARERGARSLLNAAPALSGREAVVRLADIVVVNEAEAAALPPVREGQVVIVTLGADGVRAGDVHIPGRRVEAVDTTGAGDCFVGALAARLSQGHELGAALHFANAAASIAVQRHGAAAAAPTLADITALTEL